jgi:hypothetical protein
LETYGLALSSFGFSFLETSTSYANEWLTGYGSYYHMAKDDTIFFALNECNTKKIFVGDDRSLNIVGFETFQLVLNPFCVSPLFLFFPFLFLPLLFPFYIFPSLISHIPLFFPFFVVTRLPDLVVFTMFVDFRTCRIPDLYYALFTSISVCPTRLLFLHHKFSNFQNCRTTCYTSTYHRVRLTYPNT